MRPIKQILLGAVVALFVSFLAFNTTSCSRDECGGMFCYNYGTCSRGKCVCKKEGTGGTNCEIVYRDLFTGTYQGKAPVDTVADTTLHRLVFRKNEDRPDDWETVNIIWEDRPDTALMSTFVVRLRNYTKTGADFDFIAPVQNNGYSYTGTGSVNGNTANLQLKETNTLTNTSRVFLFNNYVKIE